MNLTLKNRVGNVKKLRFHIWPKKCTPPRGQGPRKKFEIFCMGVGKIWVKIPKPPLGEGRAGRPEPRSAWVEPPGSAKKKPGPESKLWIYVLKKQSNASKLDSEMCASNSEKFKL
jgi:hypothetical protein